MWWLRILRSQKTFELTRELNPPPILQVESLVRFLTLRLQRFVPGKTSTPGTLLTPQHSIRLYSNTVLYSGGLVCLTPTLCEECPSRSRVARSRVPLMQGRVQFSELINASVLLFGRTIKYCVTNMARRSQNRARKFPTSLSTLSYKNSRVSY